jgi:hypothetical protein
LVFHVNFFVTAYKFHHDEGPIAITRQRITRFDSSSSFDRDKAFFTIAPVVALCKSLAAAAFISFQGSQNPGCDPAFMVTSAPFSKSAFASGKRSRSRARPLTRPFSPSSWEGVRRAAKYSIISLVSFGKHFVVFPKPENDVDVLFPVVPRDCERSFRFVVYPQNNKQPQDFFATIARDFIRTTFSVSCSFSESVHSFSVTFYRRP